MTDEKLSQAGAYTTIMTERHIRSQVDSGLEPEHGQDIKLRKGEGSVEASHHEMCHALWFIACDICPY